MTGEPNLRELIDGAMSQLDNSKHPDVTQVQDRLHEILVAGELGGIDLDQLTYLNWRGTVLDIGTTYSVRGCVQKDEYVIPAAIIDSPDPIRAIRAYSLNNKVIEAQREILVAERDVKHWTAVWVSARAALQALETEGK
jgi:hypothetical protein